MFHNALKNSTLTADELLHIAGSEIRICKGELAAYKWREQNRTGLAKFLYRIVVALDKRNDKRLNKIGSARINAL